MIIPALPAIQHDVRAPRRGRDLAAHRLPAHRRASRRRCSAAWATCTARRSCCSPRSACSRSARSCRAIGGSIGVLILGRAIQGAGGAIFPLAFGIIRDEFPRERVATVDRPDLGDVRHRRRARPRARRRDRRPPVRSRGSSGSRSLVTGARRAGRPGATCPSRRCACRRSIDWVGAALLSLALASLLLGVSQGNAWGWASAGVLGLFAAAVVLGAAFVACERRVPEPMVDMQLMRQARRCGRPTSPRSRSASRCSARTC